MSGKPWMPAGQGSWLITSLSATGSREQECESEWRTELGSKLSKPVPGDMLPSVSVHCTAKGCTTSPNSPAQLGTKWDVSHSKHHTVINLKGKPKD